ncbi:unnamed protein product, partial [Tilletia controversa]
FSRMAFGADIGCLTNDPACLDMPVEFAVAFDYAQNVINERLVTPMFQLVELVTGKDRKMKAAIKTIRDFAGSIIDDRLQAAQREKKASKDQGQATREPGSLAQLSKKDGKDLLDLFMETTQ